MDVPVIGEIYRHFKGGVYIVTEIGRAAWDAEKVIVTYTSFADFSVWHRLLDDWLSLKDGTIRFQKCESLKFTKREVCIFKYRVPEVVSLVEILFTQVGDKSHAISSIRAAVG